MRTINLDGLPGITLQGKKGQLGKRGNKMIYYSPGLSPEDSSSDASTDASSEGDLYPPGTKIIDLYDTNFDINDYKSCIESKTTYKPSQLDFSYVRSYLYLPPDNEPDIIQNDYFLYSSQTGTTLYLITNDYIGEDASNKIFPDYDYDIEYNDQDLNAGLINMLLWKIDEWKYSNDPFKQATNDSLEIVIESVFEERKLWTGEYFKDFNIPCIPEGFESTAPNAKALPEGHAFRGKSGQEVVNTVTRYHSYNEIDAGSEGLTFSGKIYSMETGNPITDVSIGVSVFSLNDYYGSQQPPEAYDHIYHSDLYTIAKNDGTFELTVPANTRIITVVAGIAKGDGSIPDKYLTSWNIVTQQMYESDPSCISDMKIYLYDNSAFTGRPDSYKPKYPIEGFSVVDYYTAYNTSKQSQDDTEDYVEFKTFIINSLLPDTEKRKIKIEAEFKRIEDESLALTSSCWPSLWLTKEGTTEEEMVTIPDAAECKNGRLDNLSHELTFDDENLRDFTIVLKDFGQGVGVTKYNTGIKIPMNVYGMYNIYLYAYYKNKASGMKKILLDESHITIK